jgi:Flp pilus assembly protein TadD
MAADRIASLRGLLAKNPADSRLLFGLALELEKQQRWAEVVEVLTSYLASADDEGNAWGRLGNALRQTGRDADARRAYESGITAARSHGHPSMAADFEDILADWDQ